MAVTTINSVENLRPVFTAIVFVAVLVLVLEADTPNLEDQEIMPGVTLRQFGKEMQAIADAAFGPVQKIYDDPGGTLGDHLDLYRFFASRNTKYEVLGSCASACTLVLSVIEKSNVCVGPKASFRFHQARNPDPPHAIAVETTQWMVDQLPADIQAWIEKKGGAKNMPADDVWILGPSEMWAMGYRRCED
jgi:hypothetical protein